MFNFLHTYNPQPILIQIGPFSIHWYGLTMALAALAGIVLAIRLAKWRKVRLTKSEAYWISADTIYSLALWVIIGGLLGARVYYFFYNFNYYRDHLGEFFAIWNGGLAIYGAMIGGAIAILLFSKMHKYNPWHLLDILAPSLLLGQIIGRIGNYFNQELFGSPTSLPWGIPINPLNRPAQFADYQYFHPTFLYEMLLNSVLLFILLLISRNKKLVDGMVIGSYLIGYGLIRVGMENLRTDFTPFIFGMRWQMLASIIVILIGLAVIIRQYLKLSTKPE